jgi:hypothetical protein
MVYSEEKKGKTQSEDKCTGSKISGGEREGANYL